MLADPNTLLKYVLSEPLMFYALVALFEMLATASLFLLRMLGKAWVVLIRRCLHAR